MNVPRMSPSTLLACGLCALVAMTAAAIAVAAPRHRGAHSRGAARARTCDTKAHHRRKARHRPRCRAPRRSLAKHHSTSPAGKTPGLSVTSTPGGTTSTITPEEPLAAPPTSTRSPASPAEAPPITPPSVPHVQVTAVEYSFSLSRSTVPPGKVIFEFVNDGQDEHNLNAVSSEGSLAGSFANTPAKGVRDMQLEMRAGTYMLFCSLPEHEKRGMKATLVVR